MAIWDVDYKSVLEESEEIIKQCFHEYELDEIFISFNGGKDCTVLLDVTLQILKELYGHGQNGSLKVVYIRTIDPFRELESFIRQAEKSYGLNLVTVDGGMKEALKSILEEDSRLKACLMGTRKTDPFSSNLKPMQNTDADWPQILRVSPLLNWSYHQIWSYLLNNNVPYCCLYDKGYTSVGSTLNTTPNPSLQYTTAEGELKYSAAYQLADESQERNGRLLNNNQVNGHPKPT